MIRKNVTLNKNGQLRRWRQPEPYFTLGTKLQTYLQGNTGRIHHSVKILVHSEILCRFRKKLQKGKWLLTNSGLLLQSMKPFFKSIKSRKFWLLFVKLWSLLSVQVPSFKSAEEDDSLKAMTERTRRKESKSGAVLCHWKNVCTANVYVFLCVYFPIESMGGKKLQKIKNCHRVSMRWKSLNNFAPLSAEPVWIYRESNNAGKAVLLQGKVACPSWHGY